jgi:chromosome segregation ATPase
MSKARHELQRHQEAIAADDGNIEALESLVERLEKQIEEPAIAEANLRATIKTEAAKLLAVFGFGSNSGDPDDAAHLQAAAAVEARRRGAAVAAEALVEIKATLAAAREHRAELVKQTDALISEVLDLETAPLWKRFDDAVDELRDVMSVLHGTQPYLPGAYGSVGCRSPWQNFSVTVPVNSRKNLWLGPDNRYWDFWRGAKRALMGDANAEIKVPKLAA